LLVFGSLALSFDQDAFLRVRKAVLETGGNEWLNDHVVQRLAASCTTARDALGDIVDAASWEVARRDFTELAEAFRTPARPLGVPFPLNNALLIPLVVIDQLTQYAAFVGHQQRQPQQQETSTTAWLKGDRETLGLCTGLLGAFAAAAAHDQSEFRRFGAAAVRIGMLVGIVVDAQAGASGAGKRPRSLSVAWGSSSARDELTRILNGYPEAETYISVFYDTHRATITTTQDNVAPLAQRLNTGGLKATDIGIYGRYHSAISHAHALERVLAFCDANESFQLPEAATLALPTHANNAAGSRPVEGPLHAHALRSILVEPPHWAEALDSAIRDKKRSKYNKKTRVFSFGPERSVPASLMARSGDVSVVDDAPKFLRQEDGLDRPWTDSDIAVVGMACKVPGADSADEFWDLLAAGRSQHREIDIGDGWVDESSSGTGRLFGSGPFRTTQQQSRRWFANLLDDPGHFDHRFFRKTAREAENMDPQQRLLLQVAYQAIAMSGHLRTHRVDDEADDKKIDDANNVGCFVGVHLSEYDDNVASHAANVFSATGNLQSFIAGRVSHHFGWRGPSLTVDTACSSSMVAVHQACQAIISGECAGALAAGVNVLAGSGLWFQNLGAAGFLSPTGQCRPFDAKADGYCRGEGFGAVFLKRLSQAVGDGDAILGVIAATAVEQNHNCTPIFVPNAPSLAGLFSKVVAKANVRPAQITVCEAHGTGTAVGDPAEFGAIRQVLGGAKNRDSKADKPLAVSSVKGLLGHTESSSGILSLIKVLLMLNKGLVPPQASFETANPALNLDAVQDRMFIPTRLQPWDADVRVALINNYGASGSNAAAVVMQAPRSNDGAKLVGVKGPATSAKQPFLLCGLDDKGIRRYAKALGRFLVQPSGKSCTLASLSYNLARQSDTALSTRVAFSAHSVGELQGKLAALAAGDESERMVRIPSATKPKVVLCFGGQIAAWVGLDRQLYDRVGTLRKHLNQVDRVLVRTLGAQSIFPAVFVREPIADTVVLQTALFATQYACARSWIDAGVRPATLVGHSFGELTALCVAGALSLEDALKLVVRRAGLVRDAWGDDKGAMMAVEIEGTGDDGDEGDDGAKAEAEALVAKANRLQSANNPPVSIACYNGPRSFTLAGPSEAMTALDNLLLADGHGDDDGYNNTKTRRRLLKVTNAFHSALVDPLVSRLEQSARGLRFRAPTIPLEHATREDTTGVALTARFVADHMRRPVHFHHAVRRIVGKHASGGDACIFLEAGSNSTVTAMAARVVGEGTPHLFQGVSITNCDHGWDRLTDTTVALWKAGVDVRHWAHVHDTLQPLLLPPYQFDPDAHHWLDLKAVPASTPSEQEQKTADDFLTPFGVSRDKSKGKTAALFRINTNIPKYLRLLADHVIIHTTPLCPGTVQMGFVVDAVHSLRPQLREDGGQDEPQFQEVQYHSPMCASDAGVRTSWIEVVEDDDGGGWRFEVFSTETEMVAHGRPRIAHTTGHVAFGSASDNALRRELARFHRLLGGCDLRTLDLVRGRRTGTSTDDSDVEVLGHRSIYRLFDDIAQYGDSFQRLQKLAVRGTTSAGHVVARPQKSLPSDSSEGSFDAYLADAFCQIGGMWTNCHMRGDDHNDDAIYLASGIDQWIRAPGVRRPDEFHIFATHSSVQASGDGRQQWVTDVFVLDGVSGTLLDVILGLAYFRTSKASVEKMLARLTDSAIATPKKTQKPTTTRIQTTQAAALTQAIMTGTENRRYASPKPKPRKIHSANNNKSLLTVRIKAVVANMSGLDPSEIRDDSKLADLGIDSLTSMELTNELEKAFPDVGLPEREIAGASDLAGLVQCVLAAAASTMVEDDNEDLPSTTSTSSSLSSLDAGARTGSSSRLTTPPAGSDSGKLDKDGDVPVSLQDSLALASTQLRMPAVIEAFREIKSQTDARIAEWGLANYASEVLPLQTELAVALTLEAFEELGCNIRGAAPGQLLPWIPHGGEHGRLVDHLYRMLRDECGGLVTLDGKIARRTAVAAPARPGSQVLDELGARFPDQQIIDRLTHHAGGNLARVLRGETDGVRVVFGDPVGRELVSRFYSEWPLFQALHAQLEDFLGGLATGLEQGQEPLRVLEMGAGTGGTTRRILPLLARLGVPVVYTFTDLAASFVASARRSAWAKEYQDHPRLRLDFRVHDIEGAQESEEAELAGSQHIVLATNAVHATRSLARSLAHIRHVLRPDDGVLLLLELTQGLCFLDLTFGLFEGWWLFDDGRTHALATATRWQTELHGAGFGLADWTDGKRPETRMERLIFAAAN
ncbi:hypothetical protein B0T26DRAFT_624321, partial [Lasiosphaeria miniovina]